MQSCKDFVGVENAAYLHYKKNATVYFGPGCNDGMLRILQLFFSSFHCFLSTLNE